MRIFLLVYFVFFLIADPWVDGRLMEFDSHSEIQASTEAKLSVDSSENNQFVSKKYNQESHHHNDCPESCPEHTCHLGHCGFLVCDRMPTIPPASNEQFSEYRQSVPNSPIFGIKRPPKFNA